MSDAAETLAALAPGRIGLQLTPGCAPSPITFPGPTRTHHGFTPHALRAPVWRNGRQVWQGDSLHPPRTQEAPEGWQPPADVILETMYPGYAALANGEQLTAAMDEGRWLAVDVAHLEIQRFHGLLDERTRNRLLAYDRVAEVHVSTSKDHRDSHARITRIDWGIDWAREKLRAGTPVILECYMHKLSDEERREQVALFV